MKPNTADGDKQSLLRKNLRLCLWDGIAAIPLTLLSQPGNIVMAGLLTGIYGISPRHYGLIVSLPFWFNFFQVLLAPMLSKWFAPKPLAIIGGWMHTAGWAGLTVALPFIPQADTPMTRGVFIIGISVMSLGSAIGAVSWNSWMQSVVPRRLRGKFFGARNRLLYISMIAFLLSVSGLLALMRGSLNAYIVLLGLAVVLRCFSVAWQQRMSTSTSHEPETPQLPWRAQVQQVFRHPALPRFIAFAALMGFSINLIAPFYPVFMYEQLHITVARANWMLLFGPLGAAVSFPAWGRLLDRHGNIPVMIVATILWQASSMLWFFIIPKNDWLIYVAVTAGGLFSAGYAIGVFNLLLKLTPPDCRSMGMALFVSLSCLAAALAPLTGGWAITWLKAHGHNPFTIYHTAFLAIPLLCILNCLVLKKIKEDQASPLTEVVGAMRRVRTVASLFGLNFMVNLTVFRSQNRKRRLF